MNNYIFIKVCNYIIYYIVYHIILKVFKLISLFLNYLYLNIPIIFRLAISKV